MEHLKLKRSKECKEKRREESLVNFITSAPRKSPERSLFCSLGSVHLYSWAKKTKSLGVRVLMKKVHTTRGASFVVREFVINYIGNAASNFLIRGMLVCANDRKAVGIVGLFRHKWSNNIAE